VEKLLEMAKKISDQAEVYSRESTHNSVSYQDAKLHDLDSVFQSGISLRIIKDGKLGFAYTRNLIDRQELLDNALTSLKGGVEVNYDLPHTDALSRLATYDPLLESLPNEKMVKECSRLCDLFRSQTDGEIFLGASGQVQNVRIINSRGTDVSFKSSVYEFQGSIVYPGSGSAIWRNFLNLRFEKTPDDLVHQMIQLYRQSSKVVEPKGGRMKVLFMPNSMITLTWRILSGTSAKSVHDKISPIADKIGAKIFDEKITILDDPLNDKHPGARSFDDEGVPCRILPLVKDGVLKSFFYDLDYAKKLNAESTGHGYRTAIGFGPSDPISQKPGPVLAHMQIQPGDKTFNQLVKSMDRGIILEGALGPHSGNIPNGDYSVGVSPGLYVEKGEIVGRLKDAMIAGNVYQTLKQVVDIGDTLYPSFWGSWLPPVLCDDVSVATKN
jgi:PmbA protein